MSTQARGASLEKTRDKLVPIFGLVEASYRALERCEGDAQKLNAERLGALRKSTESCYTRTPPRRRGPTGGHLCCA